MEHSKTLLYNYKMLCDGEKRFLKANLAMSYGSLIMLHKMVTGPAIFEAF